MSCSPSRGICCPDKKGRLKSDERVQGQVRGDENGELLPDHDDPMWMLSNKLYTDVDISMIYTVLLLHKKIKNIYTIWNKCGSMMLLLLVLIWRKKQELVSSTCRYIKCHYKVCLVWKHGVFFLYSYPVNQVYAVTAIIKCSYAVLYNYLFVSISRV